MNKISNVRSAARRRVRALTNNPLRGSMSFGGLATQGDSKRGVRRIMKVDPSANANAVVGAQGTPDSQILVGTNGVDGRTGASSARIVSKSVTAAPGAGKKRIRNRGQNTTLKRR